MPENSIFNTYHSILKYFDVIGAAYIAQPDGTADVPYWVYDNCPVAFTITPFYDLDAVRVTMRPGVEIEEKLRPEMINLANILNSCIATCTIFISREGELLLRDSFHAYSNSVEDKSVHTFLIRMIGYLKTFLEISPLIQDEGKTADEAYSICVKAAEEAEKNDIADAEESDG